MIRGLLAGIVLLGMQPVICPSLGQAAEVSDTILTLENDKGQIAEFRLADLDALPQITIRTETAWHSGVQEFRGPALLPLLRAHDMLGQGLLGKALNGYRALLDISGMTETYPILATRRNGNIMPVRDLGPIFIIFPYSQQGLNDARIHSQSIWQLHTLRSVADLPG